MALTIIATPGATNANSYATKAEASSVGGYFESRLFTTNWTGETAANKNTALVWSTVLLDYWVGWKGYRVDEDQALRWPRYGVEDRDGWALDSDIIPEFLREATSEFAGYLLGQSTDPTDPPDTLGFSELRVETLMMKIDKADRDSIAVLPDSVIIMVSPYGVVNTRGTPSVVDVVRT